MSAAKSKQLKITPAKGRPMLTWVGKRPLSQITAFPAEHVESHGCLEILGIDRRAPETYDQRMEVFRDLRSQSNETCWNDQPTIGVATYEAGGLLFHGDNKDVLAYLLANGYRGKVNLIYIDPPFDSGADYVRKVSLRGAAATAKIEGEAYSLGEQIQYTDIWANDNYLQFMFERLLLLKELMAQDSAIFVHTDPSRGYQIRTLMDEVFGVNNFTNELIWWYWNKMQGNVNSFASNHDTIICYRMGTPRFTKVREEREDVVRQLKRAWDPVSGSLVNARDESGNCIYIESSERTVDDVWRLPMLQPADESENLRFKTQKPEALLNIVIASSSQPGDLVLDCFGGSGTTAAVAQRLGRRWIYCDINKGALQMTAKRVRVVVEQQIRDALREAADARQRRLVEESEIATPKPAQFGFNIWRVNDYDLALQHNEAVNLACEHIGVERGRSDGYFDGTLGKSLVKVTPFGHPLTPLDLEELKRELDARPDEDRPIVVVCLGIELAARAWIEQWNRLRKGRDAVNKIEVIELRTDPKYGRFLRHEPADARIKLSRKKGKLLIEITDFISPAIVERLRDQAGLLAPKINDWRAMVDCLAIDPAYDGAIFNAAFMDVPERKSDFVNGRYELSAPSRRDNGGGTINGHARRGGIEGPNDIEPIPKPAGRRDAYTTMPVLG